MITEVAAMDLHPSVGNGVRDCYSVESEIMRPSN